LPVDGLSEFIRLWILDDMSNDVLGSTVIFLRDKSESGKSKTGFICM